MSRIIRTSQPQVPVSLTADLLSLGVKAWTYFDRLHLGQYTGVEAYKTAPVVTSQGIGNGWSSGTKNGVNFGNVHPFIPSTFDIAVGMSILYVGAPVARTSVGTIYNEYKQASPYNGLSFYVNAKDSNPQAESGTLCFVSTVVGGTRVNAQSQFDGLVHCWVCANSSGAGYIYKDGVNQALSVDQRLSGTYYDAANLTAIGGDIASAFPHTDPLLAVVIFPYVLPTQLAAEYSRNPWQIFAPLNRPVFFAGGAAAPPATIIPQAMYHYRQQQGM